MFPPRCLLPRALSDDELRRRGFRCIEPTEFRIHGRRFIVHAAAVLASVPVEETTAGHRTYTVYYEPRGTEELDEHDIAALVGEARWRQLTPGQA